MIDVLAIIPARKGSKRVPGKNKRLLGNKPLIAWSIESALRCRLISCVVVSSDDDDIIEIAKKYSGVRALKRPPQLATDEASSYDVILHALEHYPAEWIVLLQPTSPFRRNDDILSCINIAKTEDTYVRSGKANGWYNKRPACVSREYKQTVPNGAVYVSSVEWLKKQLRAGHSHPFDLVEDIKHYAMPPNRSVDIDTEEDFARAEQILAETLNQRGISGIQNQLR